jgi:hypothetical protein
MKPHKTYTFPSKSMPGDYNTVKVYKNGSMECDCLATFYKEPTCWHKKEAKKLYEQENSNTISKK